MSYDYFDRVTGSNEYERQSWRDSYNGGRAAGDWTGNTNARISAERDAFGTTWEGSSSQPSALELAQNYNFYFHNGIGNGGVPAGVSGLSQTAGPGNPRAGSQSGVSAGGGPGAGALVVAKPGDPDGEVITGSRKPRYLDLGDWDGVAGWFGVGRVTWEAAPNFVDMQSIENIYGDDIGSWPFAVAKVGYDVLVNTGRAERALLSQIGRVGNWGADGIRDILGGTFKATPESELPQPLSYSPMSSW